MAIDLIDKIKPKNNGSFPLVDAVDVEMPDGTRLSEWKGGGGGGEDGGIPTFDLVSLGMETIQFDGSATTFQTDTTEMRAALAKGSAKFVIKVLYDGSEMAVEVVMNNIGMANTYICSTAFEFGSYPVILNMYVLEAAIMAYFVTLSVESIVTEIDLTEFDSAGKIVETVADGSTRATFLQFDADGNPVKITDSKGNVTTLKW